jgi:hypothetical protein
MAKGTTSVMGVDRWWAPYATPDVDRDGVDEIMTAIAYPGPEWAIQVWLYRASDAAVEPVWDPCGTGCRSGWNTALGSGKQENGASALGGLYCGSVPTGPSGAAMSGLILWQVASDDPTKVYATVYKLQAGSMRPVDTKFHTASGNYPPTGEQSICGSPSHQPPSA